MEYDQDELLCGSFKTMKDFLEHIKQLKEHSICRNCKHPKEKHHNAQPGSPSEPCHCIDKDGRFCECEDFK